MQSAAYNRFYTDLDIINGDNPTKGQYAMRQNHEGVAVGGPHGGEQLQYWKDDLPLSEINAARPFNDSPAPDTRRKWGHGIYQWDGQDGTWRWVGS